MLVPCKCVENIKSVVPAVPGQQHCVVTILMLQKKSCAMLKAYVVYIYLSSAEPWRAPCASVTIKCLNVYISFGKTS